MKWWDFSNSDFLATFILSVCLIVVLTFIIISFAISKYRDSKFNHKLKKESNSMRVFIINYNENKVEYFNRSLIKKKKLMDISHFYSRFHENDVDRIKKWIYDICVEHKAVEEYIEADVLINHKKQSYFSLLQLLKYNSKNNSIYLQSHLFKYVVPANNNLKTKKGKVYGLTDKATMEKIISTKKRASGFTFAIRTFYNNAQIGTLDKQEKLKNMSIKDIIYNFAKDYKHPRQILDNKDNEILLFDLSIVEKEDALVLANNIKHQIYKNLEINGHTNNHNFAIGIVDNSQYYQDFKLIVDNARKACIYAQQNFLDIYLFIRSSQKPVIDIKKYTKQFDDLFRPNSLSIFFRPIIDASKGCTIGYFDYVKSYNSPFTSFMEMTKYAAKVNKNAELFSIISKEIVNKYLTECNESNAKLFMSISVIDTINIELVFKEISVTYNDKFVFVFDEEEISEFVDNLTLLNNSFSGLKEKGYTIGLLLNDKNLLLPQELYKYFDYFIVGSSMVGEIKRSSRTRLSVHTLVEQLIQYNKPIIATELESWQSVELIIQSGIYILSSEVISSNNSMLLPVDTKKIERLTNFYEKYK